MCISLLPSYRVIPVNSVLMCVSKMAYNKLAVVRHLREEIRQAIEGAHFERVLDACFIRCIISAHAYKQVLKCERSKQAARLVLLLQASVTRSSVKNYDLLLQVIREELPKERSKDLLKKLTDASRKVSSCGEAALHKSSSEPSLSRSNSRLDLLSNHGGSDGGFSPPREREPTLVQYADDDGGGLHFVNTLHSHSNGNLVQLEGQNVAPTSEGASNRFSAEGAERLNVPVQETDEREDGLSGVRHRRQRAAQNKENQCCGCGGACVHISGPGVGMRQLLDQVRNSHLECHQNLSIIDNLNKQVQLLQKKLSAALEEEERLKLKLQRQSENLEHLRRKERRQILALRENVQSKESLRTRVAEGELNQHLLRERVLDVTAHYEQRISNLEAARNRLQDMVDNHEDKIIHLQNVIIVKEEKIEQLRRSRCYQLCFFVCFVLLILFIFALFSLALSTILHT